MPELPDVTIYVEALRRMFVGQVLQRVSVRSAFLLRTFDPDIAEIDGKKLLDVSRLGKRIVWHLEDDLFAVFHLMIAGRFHCRKVGVKPRSKTDLAAFQFPEVTLMLTEASAKKRAALYIVRGENEVRAHDPQGLRYLRPAWPVPSYSAGLETPIPTRSCPPHSCRPSGLREHERSDEAAGTGRTISIAGA